jgi:hypothetical protein
MTDSSLLPRTLLHPLLYGVQKRVSAEPHLK